MVILMILKNNGKKTDMYLNDRVTIVIGHRFGHPSSLVATAVVNGIKQCIHLCVHVRASAASVN